MNEMNYEIPLLTAQVKALLGVSEDDIRRAIRIGDLKPSRLPNFMFIWPKEEVEKAEAYFIAKRARKAMRKGGGR